MGQLKAGWRFLRSEATLLANTIQAAVAQFGLGIATALTVPYAIEIAGAGGFSWQAVYGFLETGIGVGNLIGGFVIGLIGWRFGRGRMVIIGYVVWGLLLTLLALTGNVGVAIGLTVGQGIGNMIFVIPSQTLFQERTPPNLMGRVVSFRFALVLGSMTTGDGRRADPRAPSWASTAVMAVLRPGDDVRGLAGAFVPAIRDVVTDGAMAAWVHWRPRRAPLIETPARSDTTE